MMEVRSFEAGSILELESAINTFYLESTSVALVSVTITWAQATFSALCVEQVFV